MKPTGISLFVVFLVIKLSLTLENNNISSAIDLVRLNNVLCSKPLCVMKCCPKNKYVVIIRRRGHIMRICDYVDNAGSSRAFGDLVKEIFHKYPDFSQLTYMTRDGIFEVNETFKRESVSVSEFEMFNLHLTENLKLLLEVPNAYKRWSRVPNDMFCYDYKTSRRNGINKPLRPGIWVVFPVDPEIYEPIQRINSRLLIAGELVSCFFLVLVLMVYAMLPELRNLGGQILMAYVASQLGAFLLLAAMNLQQNERDVCWALTFLIYFFFMASFCWMNVMSFDIWWASRDFRNTRSSHQLCKRFKFLVYCLYAFGLPLVMTIVLLVVNETDLGHLPWIVTPKIPVNGCFIEGGEKFLYLYVPMLILMAGNWMFYLMTVYNVWRLRRGNPDSVAAAAPHAQHRHRNRFLVYLKLSIVMGLSWVLEVASFLFPGYIVWYICDMYNTLTGVTTFIIFVCNRTILKKIIRRWRNGQNSTENTSSTFGIQAQEAQELDVCEKL